MCDLQFEVVLVVVDDETDAPPLGRKVADDGPTTGTPCVTSDSNDFKSTPPPLT